MAIVAPRWAHIVSMNEQKNLPGTAGKEIRLAEDQVREAMTLLAEADKAVDDAEAKALEAIASRESLLRAAEHWEAAHPGVPPPKAQWDRVAVASRRVLATHDALEQAKTRRARASKNVEYPSYTVKVLLPDYLDRRQQFTDNLALMVNARRQVEASQSRLAKAFEKARLAQRVPDTAEQGSLQALVRDQIWDEYATLFYERLGHYNTMSTAFKICHEYARTHASNTEEEQMYDAMRVGNRRYEESDAFLTLRGR